MRCDIKTLEIPESMTKGLFVMIQSIQLPLYLFGLVKLFTKWDRPLFLKSHLKATQRPYCAAPKYAQTPNTIGMAE